MEARVGAEGIEAWPEQDAGVKSFFEAFFEPIHGLIGIPERWMEKIIATPKEFKTLEFLTKNAQRVISMDELLDKVWGYENRH